MNSYHENLRSTVVSALRGQDLDQKNLKSKLNASMFTLYYAEGAAITADEKLEAAQSDLIFKASVKEQAVKNSNTANNLLSASNQANQYLKQSMSNTAVCAANVQLAATAVIRLAGDMGSIFSIINAADSESEIYTQAEEALRLMNDTAYTAEHTSQLAMEASMLTSEVTASIVLDKAKVTNTAMNNLLKVASADVDASFQVAAANYATLASVSGKEKVAEGGLEDISVDYKAATAAYQAINETLNLNLKVLPGKAQPVKGQQATSGPKVLPATADTSFTVEFDLLKSPFPAKDDPPLYPVLQYYLLVVKESKSATFSISNAERLVQNARYQFVKLDVPTGPKPADTNQTVPVTGTQVTQQKDSLSVLVNFLSLRDSNEEAYKLRDADDEKLKLGINYVVFVMAVYDDRYKRKLNNFDDFLSAPSQAFCLKSNLAAVNKATIAIHPTIPADEKLEEEFTKTLQEEMNIALVEPEKPQYDYKMTFKIEEDPEDQVQYRCMFLPESKNLLKDQLTNASLKSLEEEVADLEKISEQYDPVIAAVQAELSELELQQQQAAQENDGDRQQVLAATIERIKVRLSQAIAEKEKAIETYTSANARLSQATHQQERAVKTLTMRKGEGKLNFFFNLALAEQVPAGNYYPAVKSPINETSAKKGKGPHDRTEEVKTTRWAAFIGPATTDNFGNLLVNGKDYIPVVLSVYMGMEENQDQFANAISDIDHPLCFTYYEKS